ncbi:hypothetical protein RIF29_39111 [Crotalaria pallida]|uniref:Uncharacterized protein n=1 Tax=Crotalaria pallida TaxID=3830 RepID=A0AAN9HPI2_CROPI
MAMICYLKLVVVSSLHSRHASICIHLLNPKNSFPNRISASKLNRDNVDRRGCRFNKTTSYRVPQSHRDPPHIPISYQVSILMPPLPSTTPMNRGFHFPNPPIEWSH